MAQPRSAPACSQPQGRTCDEPCPIERGMRILGGKWKGSILWHLKDGPVRFNELTQQLGTASRKMVNERLKEMEEVLELPFSDGARYDGRNPSSHPHLVCTGCGVIEDLDIDLRPPVAEVATSRGYADVHERLEFYGVCPRCQGK